MALLDKKFRNACKPIINSLERTPDIVNGRLCMGCTQGTTTKMTPRTRGSKSTPNARKLLINSLDWTADVVDGG